MSDHHDLSDHDPNLTLSNARQTLSLLRHYAQSGRVDLDYLDERLQALDQQLSDIEDLRASADQQHRLAALYDVSRVIGSSLDLQTVLDEVMDAIIQLSGAERGFLMLLDDDGRLDVQVARNLDRETIESGEFAVSRTILRGVVNSGEPILTTNAQTDPRFSNQASIVAHSLRSIMAGPLRARGQIIGVVYVDNRIRAGLFSEQDLDVLDAFAVQAAVAIDNARLYAEKDQALANRVEELTMLQWIDRQLNETLDMAHAMRITLEWSARLCDAQSASLGLLEPASGVIKLVAHWGETDEFSNTESLSLDHPLIVRVFDTQEAALQMSPLHAKQPRTVLAVPIRRENNVIGVVTLVADRIDAFDEDAQGLVSRLADRAAIAIENGQLYDAVQQANRAKSEFVSLVAHELKVPMTSISGYADLLTMVGELSAQQETFVHTIKKNVQRMTVLVSDLNDISRIESGQLFVEPAEVDLDSVVQEAKEAVMRQVTERGHTWQEDLTPGLPLIYADRSRVVQVLVNLLSNAYKYTPDGGTITLETGREDEYVWIQVTDSGVGMTPEQVAKLGTKFWRADNAHVTNQPGSGLGLAITWNLLALMGGEMTVTSAPGEGSTFAMRLPIAQSEA